MRMLALIILLLGLSKALHAQTTAIDFREEIKNGQFQLWVKNNLPCTSQIYAEAPTLNRRFHLSLSKQSERMLFKVPVDSIQNIDQFKDELQYNLLLGDFNAIHDPKYLYMLPYPEGNSHKLIQGNNGDHTHNTPESQYAFDFKMDEGSYVTAARGGVVGFIKEHNKEGGKDKRLMNKVNLIMICHDDGTIAIYAHLKHRGALVDIGEHVFAGQVIGLSGNTGYSTGPHLHFSVLAGERSVPIRFRNLPETLVEGESYEQNFDY